jgi:hypothetical protein
MGERDWKREYEALLERTFGTADMRSPQGTDEQRFHPRWRMRSGTVGVHLEVPSAVVDISASGISFCSQYSFQPGQRLELVMDGALMVGAQVVECQSAQDPGLPWLVHCSFQSADDGPRLLVLLEAMGELVPAPKAG